MSQHTGTKTNKLMNSPEVNGSILSKLFQVRGNNELWHKDGFKGEGSKLIGSHVKTDVRAISGGTFVFLSVCLLVKMKTSIFSIFRFIVWVTLLDKTRGEKRNKALPDSEGFICKEIVDIPIWLDSIRTCAVNCLICWKLSSTSANPAARKPRLLCNSSFCFLFESYFICVTHFMNSKRKNLTIVS